MQHKKQKDWSNLETNFKRELFKEGDLNLRKLKLTRKTEGILDELRKSMAEYRRNKKTSTASPYYPSNESAYSLAHSTNSDKDSFSIYQRATYQPSSPVPSVYVNGAPLKSALKKTQSLNMVNLREDTSVYGQAVAQSQSAVSLREDTSVYGEGAHNEAFELHDDTVHAQGANLGVDNAAFENDNENFKEEADNGDEDEIAMYEARQGDNDTFIWIN